LRLADAAGALVTTEITDGIDRADQRNECSQPNHQRAERVGPEKAFQSADLAVVNDLQAEQERQARNRDKSCQVHSFPPNRRTQSQAKQTGHQRDEKEQNQQHGIRFMVFRE